MSKNSPIAPIVKQASTRFAPPLSKRAGVRDCYRQRQNIFVALICPVRSKRCKDAVEAQRVFERALKINRASDILRNGNECIRPASAPALLPAVGRDIAEHLGSCKLGATLLLFKRLTAALAVFDRLLQIVPNYAPALNNRGEALKELGRDEEAIASYRQALALEPQNVQAWSNLGDGLFRLARHDEAFAAYDKALALKPDMAEAWLGRGNVFFALKRYDVATAAYDKACARKPNLAEAWLGRGNVLAERKGHDDALAAYDKALGAEPDLAGAWLGRGNVFYAFGRYEVASAAYERALALKADLADAWLGRGNIFYELKCYDDAFAAYGKRSPSSRSAPRPGSAAAMSFSGSSDTMTPLPPTAKPFRSRPI